MQIDRIQIARLSDESTLKADKEQEHQDYKQEKKSCVFKLSSVKKKG